MPTFFDLSASFLFASLFWGAIGTGLFIFGKKQRSEIPLIGGIVMIGISYFVVSAFFMSLGGIAILVLIYCLKKQGY